MHVTEVESLISHIKGTYIEDKERLALRSHVSFKEIIYHYVISRPGFVFLVFRIKDRYSFQIKLRNN